MNWMSDMDWLVFRRVFAVSLTVFSFLAIVLTGIWTCITYVLDAIFAPVGLSHGTAMFIACMALICVIAATAFSAWAADRY